MESSTDPDLPLLHHIASCFEYTRSDLLFYSYHAGRVEFSQDRLCFSAMALQCARDEPLHAWTAASVFRRRSETLRLALLGQCSEWNSLRSSPKSAWQNDTVEIGHWSGMVP